MKFKVKFTLNDSRKCGITTGYRPTWCSINKTDHNSAAISFDEGIVVEPGESYIGIIHPLAPEFWEFIMINDTLQCMEGPKQVGDATVIKIIQDVPVA